MTCQHCGKKIRKDQTVCPWCGKSQNTEKAPEQVRLSAAGATKKRVLTPKQKKWLLGIGITVGAVVLALVVTVVSMLGSMLGQINRESELSEGEIGINSNLQEVKDITNIALFGLDTRNNNESGRSDAIIILSIDRVHDKIKLTSIARDSVVNIEGRGEDKITHAFAYGKAKLAVKTLNQNFGMNITDYAYINFFEFAEIINYIGGVMIDVNTSEMNVMNNHYGPELTSLGFDYQNVATPGYQRLNGPQALAYSRNRYSDSDIGRGNRQKEVLEAMFAEVKDIPMTKYPSVISKVLSTCHTTLTNTEMLSIATWAVSASPSFEQFSLPNTTDCRYTSDSLRGMSVLRYDLDLATKVLHTYIYEDVLDASATVATTAHKTTTKPSSTVGSVTTSTTVSTTTTTTTTALESTGSTESTTTTQAIDPTSASTTDTTDTTTASATDAPDTTTESTADTTADTTTTTAADTTADTTGTTIAEAA